MSDKFVVKQSNGKDSTVTVDVLINSNDIKFLVFDTDQNLLDDSGRAFQVSLAIREYACQRGYNMPETIAETQMASSRYDVNFHKRIIRSEIKGVIETQRAIARRLEIDLPNDILFLFNDILELINN